MFEICLSPGFQNKSVWSFAFYVYVNITYIKCLCDDIIEMSNKKSTLAEKSLYDIHGYTDNELYDILDLVNPSDRE